jgi:putative transposase
MPRANRYFLPGRVWHLTHRCHKREFLLKFARDRRSYIRWLFEVRKRFGLCVLDFMVTSNHVHLLVKDSAEGVIARSMQLIAGRSAQEYNRRKARLGAFWEDRYHATAIEAGPHLHRCVVYIDLNMVRAGMVKHPREWLHSGYVEIQQPPTRYRVIDLKAVSELCGFGDVGEFQKAHREWVDTAVSGERFAREAQWSESIAVGGEGFVEEMKVALGFKGQHRQVAMANGVYTLQEPAPFYGHHFDRKKVGLRANNTIPWRTVHETTET